MTIEAMKQALEALESVTGHFTRTPSTLRDSEVRGEAHKAITTIREALAEQPAQQEPVKFKVTVIDDEHPDGVPLENWGKPAQQEPFCYHDGRNIVGKEYADHSDVFPLYTAPRQWQGLTKDEVDKWELPDSPTVLEFAKFIEAKLKEKNG